MFGLLCEGGVNTFWKVVEFYKNKNTLQMEQQKSVTLKTYLNSPEISLKANINLIVNTSMSCSIRSLSILTLNIKYEMFLAYGPLSLRPFLCA